MKIIVLVACLLAPAKGLDLETIISKISREADDVPALRRAVCVNPLASCPTARRAVCYTMLSRFKHATTHTHGLMVLPCLG